MKRIPHDFLAGSRRRFARILVGLPLGGVVGMGAAGEPAAKKKHKKKCKKAKVCAGKCGSVRKCKKTFDCGPCETCDVCSSGCPFSSVRDAINAADDGDTIAICAGTYTGDLDIDKDLTLRGAGTNGEHDTILQGTGERSVIKIATGTTVTLQDLIVLGGHADQGGGIENRGDLEVARCLIDHNQADSYGGGIFHVDGQLTVSHSTIRFNTAGTNGGGIFNSGGLVEMESCVVIGNESTLGGGGGIANTFGGVLDLKRTNFIENSGRDGGGLSTSLGGTADLFDCVITRNTSDDSGAGIAISGSSVVLTSTDVTDNEAGLLGGGIYVQDWGSDLAELTLDSTSRVTGNQADPVNLDSGGGIYNLDGTVTLANADIVTGNFPNNCEGDVPQCSG